MTVPAIMLLVTRLEPRTWPVIVLLIISLPLVSQ
jgi:hypothetical protein